jgi:hypothetical protein
MIESIYEWLMIVGGVLAVVLYFAYGPYERRRLKIKHSKPPDEVIEILNGLPAGWNLNSYEWFGGGWQAEIGIDDRRFHLCEDYGRIFLDEVVDNNNKVMSSPHDRQWIAGGPETIRQQLLDAVPPKE